MICFYKDQTIFYNTKNLNKGIKAFYQKNFDDKLKEGDNNALLTIMGLCYIRHKTISAFEKNDSKPIRF